MNPAGAPAASRNEPNVELPARAAIDTGRAEPLFLSLLPTGPALAVGRPMRLEIAAESENDFATVAMTLAFDAGALDVAAVHPGSLMARAGAVATLRHHFDRGSGRLTVEVREQPDGPPVSGGGTLATVELVPRRAGDIAISFAQVEVRDLNDERVRVAPGERLVLSVPAQ
jgi:hypothetical protein